MIFCSEGYYDKIVIVFEAYLLTYKAENSDVNIKHIWYLHQIFQIFNQI